MEKREELLESCEDALFAVLVAHALDAEGEALLAEAERLNAEEPGTDDVPGLDRRCLGAIRAHERKTGSRRVVRRAYNLLSKAATAALIAAVLVVGVFAAFPEVRAGALNLLITVSESDTELYVPGSEQVQNPGSGEVPFFGYTFEIPEGWEHVESEHSLAGWYDGYSRADGAELNIEALTTSGSKVFLDTEDADLTEQIKVNGWDGLHIIKGTTETVAWADMDAMCFVMILTYGAEDGTAMEIAGSAKLQP